MQVGRSVNTAWYTGILLGFAGALLDFYSSYQLLVQSGTTGEMGMIASFSSAGLAWGIGVAALGVVLAATSLAYLRPVRMRKMKDFGFLMVVYGLAMLFIGVSMYLGITSMATGVVLPAIGMLIVGVTMLANGVLMQQSFTGQMMA
jgi:threonine/homoserine efflux transporter RhtA